MADDEEAVVVVGASLLRSGFASTQEQGTTSRKSEVEMSTPVYAWRRHSTPVVRVASVALVVTSVSRRDVT